MSLVQHNHMIQTFASDRTNQAFRVRILPRRARRRNHFFEGHVADAPLKDVAIDAIAITNQESLRCIVRKRLDDFLRRPSCRWMCCDVEVDDMPPFVAQHDKGEEYAKRGRWDDEEVDGDDVGQVISQESPPGL